MTEKLNRREAQRSWSQITEDTRATKLALDNEVTTLRAERDKLVSSVKRAEKRAEKVEHLSELANTAVESMQNTNTRLNLSIDESNKLAEKVAHIQKDTQRLYEDAQANNSIITELLDLGDKAALGGDFTGYSKSYEKRADLYLGAIVLTILALLALLGYMISKQGHIDGVASAVEFFVKKLALAAPFAYLIYVFTKLHNRAAKLAEAYKFKSAVSLSMKANKELLAELYASKYSVKAKEGVVQYPVAEFAKAALTDVYTFPDDSSSTVSANAADEPKLTYFATRQTKRALTLLREFSEIIKNIKPL